MFYPNRAIFSSFKSFNLNLIADMCFETGNYQGNYIDYATPYDSDNNHPEDCQKHCQDHPQCKFWSYNTDTKTCWRHTENAPTVLGTCATCLRGPRFCSGKH